MPVTNAYVTSSRVALLLGAGASVPLGMPTTNGLREALCTNGPDIDAMKELHRSAAYRFRVPENTINIEDFLEHLYELQLMLWLAQRSELPDLLPGFTANSPTVQAADDTLGRVQQTVLELVHSTCGDCSGERADTLWRPILQAVAEHQPVIPVFTLNYDWTFEKLAIEQMSQYHLTDGFDLLGGTWDPQRLTAAGSVPKKVNILLAKLHGSTNWLPGGPVKSLGSFPLDTDQDSDFPPHQFEMVYPGHVHETWLGKESWRRLHGPDGMFGQWVEQEPYATLYAMLRSTFRRARLILVIGYAFRDEHVNRELFEALRTNVDLRVVVLDPGTLLGKVTVPPYNWLTFKDLDTDWTRLEWLPGCFGTLEATTRLLDAVRAAP